MRWLRNVFHSPFQAVFLIVFWSLFFIAPTLMRQSGGPPPSPGRGAQYWAAISPYLQALQMLNIPLFFINSELLMPFILRKKGIIFYLVSLLLACVGFVAVHHFCRIDPTPSPWPPPPPLRRWTIWQRCRRTPALPHSLVPSDRRLAISPMPTSVEKLTVSSRR